MCISINNIFLFINKYYISHSKDLGTLKTYETVACIYMS